MTEQQRKRAPGGGRHSIYDEPMKTRNIPMTDAQREKLRTLGGAAWVRAQIDEAVIPRATKKTQK